MSRPASQTDIAAQPALRNFVAGEWQVPGCELPNSVCNSNTGEVIAQQLGSTPVQIAAAIAAADEAHRSGVWRKMPAKERSAALLKIAAALDLLVDAMAHADAAATGVPITHTRIIGKVCGAAFRGAAALAEESATTVCESDYVVERLPLGPAAIIGPWNAPSGIACHKLASALAAGCPVVFKPSEWAPSSGQMIAEAVASVDLPHGVFQLLHGDGMTGAAIVGDPRIAAVSFTGGLAAGRAVAATCAHQIKPAQLELGGNNAMLVLPSADIAATADGVVRALTTLNGQWCRALGRLIVHESIMGELLDAVMHRLGKLQLGDSSLDSTDVGPLVHEAHRQQVQTAIDNYRTMGGEILQSSTLPPLKGWFIAPTLVRGIAPQDALDEIFGPVATVHGFTDVNEAVSIANLAPYGLAAYVFGDRQQAYSVARELEAGMVKVNAVTLFGPHPSAPRPAWKLSGAGDEGTRETFEFFRGSRVIGVPEGLPESC